jgi:N-acetylglucosaminyldiphosphoundecaprenol N-acetyl-beta-D-mannosaminyltransferase
VFPEHEVSNPSQDHPIIVMGQTSSRIGRVSVAGVEVDNITEGEALSLIDDWVAGSTPHYMVVVNAAKLAAANQNRELRESILNADLVTADGMAVVWASRLLGERLKQRVTGIDLFERLVGQAARTGASIYLLGATHESVSGLVKRFKLEHPNLRVGGWRNGYIESDETERVIDEIKRSEADLLFVAMGSPRQDLFIARNLEATGVKFALGVGGAFDHLSGRSRRAPLWMQRSGLEWLYRLIREPRRLWRRYLVGNSIFLWLVAKQLLGRGGSGKPDQS